jgi:hypothetical protein
MNLQQRIRRVETSIDVSRLSGEQVRRLDLSRLSLEQIQALDIARLTDEQVVRLDFATLTDAQLAAVSKGFDDKFPEMAAVIESLTDDELTAIKEWRLCPWHPGYKGEFGS